LDQYSEELSAYKNVVGMGVVRLEDENDDADAGSEAVAVYVSTKLPEKELQQKDIIPRILEISGRDNKLQIPTKVIEQGEVSLESDSFGIDIL
jgi:hypothetical protein